MIIMDELPFKFVERERFRHFCSILQPKFRLISRTTVARDCLELFSREKEKLRDTLTKCNQRICLTTDLWTSLQNISYICITAHFIDNDWKLHKRILNFSVISSHKGVVIGQAVESCMLQWGIEKVCTITVDNASSNDTVVAHLKKKISKRNGFILDGDFFHVRCSAHILNLIVRYGIEEVQDSISRIRGAIRYIRSSPQRSQQFKLCCEQERIASKCTLCLDVPTRWNYTYLMLETALKFQKAFERLDDQELNFASDLNAKDGIPSEWDWENAKVLTKFLENFYDVTKRMSGSLYVTANSYFHEVCGIEQILNDWSKSSDTCLSVMAMKMKEKFDKYWGNIDKINMMLLIAVVLDPRYKLRYVKFCYGKVYTLEKVNELIRRVRELMNRMYVHYQMLDSTSSSPSIRMTQSSNEMEVDQLENEAFRKAKSIQHDFLKHLEEEESASSKFEVDRYLEESLEKETSNFEILDWWRMNSSRYRILSQVARDVLAIPVSTVASE
uniref:Zinc finger BED domain-containing protein RICESLEEPER 2-like n=1 Tax=Davidia involucrata TaxID=16924 RepID=A0A5B7B6B6_DAVIN